MALAAESPTITKSLTLDAQGAPSGPGRADGERPGCQRADLGKRSRGGPSRRRSRPPSACGWQFPLTLRDVGVAEQGTGADDGMRLDAPGLATFAVIHSHVSFGADSGVASGSSPRSPPGHDRGNRQPGSPNGSFDSQGGIGVAATVRLRFGRPSSTTRSPEAGGCICPGGGHWLGAADSGRVTAQIVGQHGRPNGRAGVAKSDALVFDNVDSGGRI